MLQKTGQNLVRYVWRKFHKNYNLKKKIKDSVAFFSQKREVKMKICPFIKIHPLKDLEVICLNRIILAAKITILIKSLEI